MQIQHGTVSLPSPFYVLWQWALLTLVWGFSLLPRQQWQYPGIHTAWVLIPNTNYSILYCHSWGQIITNDSRKRLLNQQRKFWEIFQIVKKMERVTLRTSFLSIVDIWRITADSVLSISSALYKTGLESKCGIVQQSVNGYCSMGGPAESPVPNTQWSF